MSLSNLAFVLTDLGLPSEALAPVDRAISIYVRHGDPNSLHLALALINRGDALRSLGRFPEARTSFESGIRILTGEYGAAHPAMGEALIGVGTILLAEGEVTRAVSVLEQALGVLANYNGFATSRAGAQAALARALWDTHGDRRRARLLAESALAAYVSQGRANKAEVVRAWLDSHPIGRKVSRSVRVTKATPGSPQAM
jgi:tetratricopeptide (TPR) repeat protein